MEVQFDYKPCWGHVELSKLRKHMNGALPIFWLLVGEVNQSFATEINTSSVSSVFFTFSDYPNEYLVCTYLFMCIYIYIYCMYGGKVMLTLVLSVRLRQVSYFILQLFSLSEAGLEIKAHSGSEGINCVLRCCSGICTQSSGMNAAFLQCQYYHF
jgi:hypothetical protein